MVIRFEKKSWKWITITIILIIIVVMIGLWESKNVQINSDLFEKGDIGIIDEESIEDYEKEQLIEMVGVVKQIEELDHRFSSYYLTYEKYIIELNKLNAFFPDWINEESHYDRKYIPNPLDIRQYSQDQLDNIRETIENPDKIEVEISKAYNYEGNIYIFTKSTLTNNTAFSDVLINRRYDIGKVDGNLKIKNINIYIYDDRTEEKKIEYNKNNNVVVDYIHSFDPLK